jgi:hypothetical protein
LVNRIAKMTLATNVSSVETERFQVYPNPTTGSISIEVPQVSEDGCIRVFNPLGALVLIQTFTASVPSSLSLTRVSGLYVIQTVTTGGLVKNEKVLKQ